MGTIAYFFAKSWIFNSNTRSDSKLERSRKLRLVLSDWRKCTQTDLLRDDFNATITRDRQENLFLIITVINIDWKILCVYASEEGKMKLNDDYNETHNPKSKTGAKHFVA